MLLVAILVMGLLALICAIGLVIAAKKFAIKESDKIKEIKAVLPGTNCGACGLAGCDAFAQAVVAGKVPIDGCIVGKQEVAKKIAEILGKEYKKE